MFLFPENQCGGPQVDEKAKTYFFYAKILRGGTNFKICLTCTELVLELPEAAHIRLDSFPSELR